MIKRKEIEAQRGELAKAFNTEFNAVKGDAKVSERSGGNK